MCWFLKNAQEGGNLERVVLYLQFPQIPRASFNFESKKGRYMTAKHIENDYDLKNLFSPLSK